MVSTAFKLENFGHRIPLTTPYISFVGKIYSKPNQIDNDCVMGVNVNEYNSFNFTNKGRIDFKIQVVYDVKPDSRFKKLTPKFEIGKTIFIAGSLDLDDDQPFVEAKEIDLLEDSAVVDHPNTDSQSLFSRTQKFKNTIKKEKSLDTTEEVVLSHQFTKNNNNEDNSETDLTQYSKKTRYLNKGKNNNECEEPNKIIKHDKRKKEFGNSQSLKKTKVITRSQKQNEELDTE